VPRRLIPLIITLALLLPGLVAGGWVGYYYIHQRRPVLLPTPTPRVHSAPAPLHVTITSGHGAAVRNGAYMASRATRYS